jgi:squalene-associated FAD-dependent desaturase
MSTTQSHPCVTVIGGGLSGLAATVALAERGCEVELFETRRQLGGRTSSFVDSATGETIDNCQHVSLGCCTYLADFCRRTQIEQHFVRHRKLHFRAADGRSSDFAGASWLPAPLHLGPALMGLRVLSLAERIGVARAMVQLARWQPSANDNPTVSTWLRSQNQDWTAVQNFWEPVLVSALAETLDRASLSAARKVFVDGFMRHREAYEMLVPQIPLGQLYGEALQPFFVRRGVQIHLGTGVDRICVEGNRVVALQMNDGRRVNVEQLVIAVPWRRLPDLVADVPQLASWSAIKQAEQLESSPITGVHLWFDRPIMDLPHAVLVGTLSQWVFHRVWPTKSDGHYYQVVISASRSLAEMPREEAVRQIVGELQRVFPVALNAKLLRSRVVTEQHAVFSPRPGVESLRPPATTPLENLALAGDWIATDWPATMEGAVRSGYRAAEVTLAALGHPQSCAVAELPEAWLSWLLTRGVK